MLGDTVKDWISHGMERTRYWKMRSPRRGLPSVMIATILHNANERLTGESIPPSPRGKVIAFATPQPASSPIAPTASGPIGGDRSRSVASYMKIRNLYNNCVFHRPFLRCTFNVAILLFTILAL